jgi:HPt (histidine-containing phosphotransfer) domain-containing protein
MAPAREIGHLTIVSAMVRDFLLQVGTLRPALERCAGANDTHGLSLLLHSPYGSTSSLGLNDLALLAAAGERTCRSGALPDLDVVARLLREVTAAVESWLSTHA